MVYLSVIMLSTSTDITWALREDIIRSLNGYPAKKTEPNNIKKLHALAKRSQSRRCNPPRACKKSPKSIPVRRLTFSVTKDTNHSQGLTLIAQQVADSNVVRVVKVKLKSNNLKK